MVCQRHIAGTPRLQECTTSVVLSRNLGLPAWPPSVPDHEVQQAGARSKQKAAV
jgi:hypothetical protein